MKHQADKKRRHFEFQLGEHVLVKLQPYQQSSVALWKYQKFGSRNFGSLLTVCSL